MRAEILPCGHPAWTAFLDRVPHDFYHLPAYVDLCARRDGGEGLALWVGDDRGGLLVPLVVNAVPGGDWRDGLSPYGYPGPLLEGPADPGRWEVLLGTFVRAAQEAGLVSAFLRLHPLLPLPPVDWRPFGQRMDHGETIYLDLTLPVAEQDRQTRANHRTGARRLLAAGFRVEVDGWDRLEAFSRIYLATMAQRGAGPAYRFGLDYFQELQVRLGGRLHLAMVLDPGGREAAGGLFSHVDGLMQFHLAGTDPDYRHLGPAKLMILHMRDWGREAGARRLHLGGGVGCADDSLALFKRGFSALRAPFATVRLIFLPETYRALAGAADTGDGFFPAYRKDPGPHD